MEITPELNEALEVEADNLTERAAGNMEQYGYQDLSMLVICATEELGEVAKERIWLKLNGQASPRAAINVLRQMCDEARDLGALCLQIGALCEKNAARIREGLDQSPGGE